LLEIVAEMPHHYRVTAFEREFLATDEPSDSSMSARLNWLRAGVLGANDGIVSTAALVLGVAGATASRGSILLAGLIGLLAGAMSMAAGEYVSVSTQRDSERAVLRRQHRLLAASPERQLAALAAVYAAKGLDERTAFTVAEQLTAHDALAAHAEVRHGIDPEDLTNPWHAALASFLSFAVGALVPLAGVFIGPNAWVTVAFVTVALLATGAVSAQLGRAPIGPAVLRNVGGGLLAMAITFGLGTLVGTFL
jgi:VIT1/CCC1 family predicted Fe2+/Mn2+ transporter